MTEIHNLFTRHRLEWTTLSLGRHSEEFVREFYASYVTTLRSQIYWRAALIKQDPLKHVRVCSIQVDISKPAIRRYTYAEDVDTNMNPFPIEFDFQWQIIIDGQFLR